MMKRFASAAAAGLAGVLVSLPAWALTASYSAHSTQTADAVWAKVGDFCGIQTWLPPVDKCVLSNDGKTRTLTLKGGGEVVENLVSRDDKKRSYTYRIVSGPLPVDDYKSTIHVIAAPHGATVKWDGTFKAKGASDADAKKTILGIYKAGADNLAGQ